MRITEIVVKDLFGLFNHSIPFNIEERITIMFGPNGYGKTILLNMVDSLFRRSFNIFYQTPFSELIIKFDDGGVLTLNKPISEEEKSKPIVFEYCLANGEKEVFTRAKRKVSPVNIARRIIAEEGLPVRRMGANRWRFMPTDEILTATEIVERYGAEEIQVGSSVNPPWLLSLLQSINVRLLDTQRLIIFPSETQPWEIEDITELKPSISKYSKELAQAIKMTLAAYGTTSQSLDRTFPLRLFQQGGKSLDKAALRKKLALLEEKRARLVDTGLLDKEALEQQIPWDFTEKTRNVLSVYATDVEVKLEIFDTLANKIDLFKTIINRRFSYKHVDIDKDSGFVFTYLDGKHLDTTNLSSGEQQEVVLLYEFLFRTKENSLFLIDEPEISLHVDWQLQFLKDFQEVASLGIFDTLIATHSPQIINERWDLTVELQGPK